MTRLDGVVADQHGTTWMLVFDALAGVVGLVLLAGVVLARNTLWPVKIRSSAA
jgi:hypothetical protein